MKIIITRRENEALKQMILHFIWDNEPFLLESAIEHGEFTKENMERLLKKVEA